MINPPVITIFPLQSRGSPVDEFTTIVPPLIVSKLPSFASVPPATVLFVALNPSSVDTIDNLYLLIVRGEFEKRGLKDSRYM